MTGLAAGLLARRALELAAVIQSGRFSRRRLAGLATTDEDGAGNQRIVCVVPLYLEQEIAADAVRFWHHLVQRTHVDQVVFVTTAKEKPGHDATTHDLVASELDALGHPERLRHLHCDEVTRFRAAQLNLAVDQAGPEQHRPVGQAATQTWIGVYNADSRPADTTFAELWQRIDAEPDTRVFQQLVDYVVPDRAGTGAVAVGNSVLQTWWTRSHYYARNTRGARAGSWSAAITPYSTFGHGEFVRLDFLDDIGGFPDFAYADGLLLGWICRLRGEPIGLLASRDLAEVPRTVRDLVTQQTAWMRGLLNFDATVAWCREHDQLRLTDRQLAGLRAAHGAIPVAWGLSTVAVLTGVTVVAAAVARRGATRGDAVRLAGLLASPVVPAFLLPGTGDRPGRLAARLAGVAASWPVEGLAFWPALAGHLRRGQQAPAKTPR
ncbi:glycosyltransferase family 2 protein [Asanoa iriomotensis]|uniref:glycosyltransferase family 2 protein n=1 Tax=Asanoa iriomotensis TaxID=234613 RepID=UPI0019446A05|nr:glycosyltransferase family 2 protein [Asanoa iriomotensis]